MSLISDAAAFVLAAITAVIGPSLGPLERRVERSFEVRPDSAVVVAISGGSISVATVPGRTARLTLIQRVNADTDAEADAELARYDLTLEQRGDQVVLAFRQRDRSRWRSNRGVSASAVLEVPADVRLDLDTSGGSITVRGARERAIAADTSGGSITVDGGTGDLALDTSGGSIRVGRALGVLHADTSGGSITVDYVGASARDVAVNTSGGSIRVGVDRGARLHVNASTSGGSVSATDLPLAVASSGRSKLVGTMNGGGGRLLAATSGGSVRIYASAP